MIRRNILIGLCVFFLGLSTSTYAADTEVVLDTDDSTSGFTVKDLSLNDIFRVGGDGRIDIDGWISAGPGNSSLVTERYPFSAVLASPSSIGLALYYNNAIGLILKPNGTIRSIHTNKLTFMTNNAERLVIDPNGNVGIGTGSATLNSKLRITDNSAKTEPFWSSGSGYMPARIAMQNLNSGDDTKTGISFAHGVLTTGYTPTGIFSYRDNGGNTFNDRTAHLGFFVADRDNVTDADERMTITEQGNVGIGTTDPTNPLEMVSGAYVSGGGVWTDASSREYKKNIENLSMENAFETLEGLKPVTFKYKNEESEKYVGFIAEDVPELVATEDRKGLSPMDITAVLTKVVQEQQTMLKEQQEVISALSAKVKSLEDRI